MTEPHPAWPRRLPFYYGWVIVAVAFVTMSLSVTARTSFSLLLPPLTQEFGWPRGLAAGAFSFGFLVSAVISPGVGRIMDRRGPRVLIEAGVVMLAAGLLLAPAIHAAWQLYVTIGVLVGVGGNLMSFTVQSQYLPNWFARRRALAISIAFSGVGVGAILLLPWLQTIIAQAGWRAACRTLGLLVLCILGPLNLLVWKRPQLLGLLPDGTASVSSAAARRGTDIVDPAWAGTDWTLGSAARTARFWWIVVGYFCGLFAWYTVQVHQTTYLVEIGFSPLTAAWALGFVAVVGIPGQISLGALSDRVGREWIWTAGCIGFAVCYIVLLLLEHSPSTTLLYIMVLSQGFLGYALTSVMGPIVVEIFEGPHFGAIFGTINVALIIGGALGPWLAGVIHDITGTYRLAFLLALACCAVSAACVWMASPRKVRLVPGRVSRA